MKEDSVYLPDEDLGSTVRSKVVKLRGLDREIDEKRSKRKKTEDLFAHQCRTHGLPAFAREYEFAKELNRRWKFDFAFALKKPSGRMYRLAVEVEGIVMRRGDDGNWIMGGRHADIKGYKEDNIKYATATLLGWNYVRFEQSQVASKFAVGMVMRILSRQGWTPKT